MAAVSLLVCGLGCSGGAGPASSSSGGQTGRRQKPIHVAYVTNGVASFWTIAAVGAKAAGRDLGVEVSVHMPAEGIGDQKRIIEDLLIRGVDGIAISPIDPANQTDLLNRAAEVTNLITQDADAPESNRLCYIGMDNYVAGRMCGQLVKEAMPDGGTVMIFVGRLEQDNARRRRQGVIDELLDRSPDPNRYDPPGKVLKGQKYTILGT
ncbi:MAG: substrate-binding domain-containing protein, partial [Planctomycetes bacterium]|nr:substrate-binding domain-containing protein [Planctomycetota bacterium]